MTVMDLMLSVGSACCVGHFIAHFNIDVVNLG